MKNLFVIFILFFVSLFYSSLYAQTLFNCKRFKNGTFKIYDQLSGTATIQRKGSRQIESIEGKGTFDFKVKWLNSCTYTLTPTKETYKKMPHLPKNATITVSIIELKENSYIQVSNAPFMPEEFRCEMVKVK